jgi:DNA polymerase family B
MIGFDSEDDTKGNVLVAAAVEGSRIETFRDMEQARAFFLDSPPRTRFAAHNLGYDLNNVFGGSRFRGLSITMNGAGILYARAKSRKFFDSSRHFGARLSTMGNVVGIPKMEYDFDADRRGGGIAWSPRLEEYCVNDARIVSAFIERLETIYEGLGTRIGVTGASTALRLWRERFAGGIKVQRLPKDLLDYLFEAYYGGRVEAFYIGRTGKRMRYYDVNSMFPAVMKEKEYAFPYEYRTWPDLGKHGVTEATVTVPERSWIPPLPCRVGEKILFPTGRMRGCWTNVEIEYARSKGVRLERIHSGVHFPKSCRPFAEYVDTLYTRRKESTDESDRTAYKILLNSLYGKFAQREAPSVYQHVSDPPPPGATHAFEKGEIACYPLPELGYPAHTNVIWSAEITAHARIRLHEGLERVLASGALVYYCDTDSLVTEGVLPESRELGEWKKEYEIEEAEFLAPKVYRFREVGSPTWHVRVKGVPCSGSVDGVKTSPALAFMDKGSGVYDAPMKLREALARSCIEKLNVWERREKFRSTVYDKREVLSDGWTRPIKLGA